MSAIRNHNVAVGKLADGASIVVYTVPVGFVLLLKDVTVDWSSGATLNQDWYLRDPTSATDVRFLEVRATTVGPIAGVMWHALNGGQSVVVTSNGAASTYWVSGALLPFTP